MCQSKVHGRLSEPPMPRINIGAILVGVVLVVGCHDKGKQW